MDGFPNSATHFAPTSFAPLRASTAADADPTTQATLKTAIDCVGTALHTGARVAMALRPAPADHGIVFRRRDLGIDIPARFDHVVDTRLSTVLGLQGAAEARVATIEHLMAAFAATGVTSAVVEVDGPELPILDGSAAGFVFLIDCAGITPQDTPRAAIAIQRTVRVDGPDGSFAELRPSLTGLPGLAADISIDFPAAAIGAQSLALQVAAGSIRRELAPARTFCLLAEVEAMQQAGLARGGSLDNAVVVDDERILNPAGLRMEGEFVRHKLLDAVGDLALAGAVLHGVLRAHRPGHGINNRLLTTLFADASNWRLVGGTMPLVPAPASRAANG
jgi:UDP-3-O-[3-hydroxymyristoyl] N-acetylglucosamine deacetylase